MPLLYFVGSVIRDRGEDPVYDGYLWCVDPDDVLGPDGGPRDPEPVRFAAVGEPEEAETLARLLNDRELIKAQRDALLDACEEGVRMRSTPIVDDDFPLMRDRFDRLAAEALALARRPS
jgi:hypothetical protein